MTAMFLSCPFCNGEKIRDRYIRDGRQVYCADCSASVTAFQPNASENATSLWNCRFNLSPDQTDENPRAISQMGGLEPIGYVTKSELVNLRFGISCVDLFKEPDKRLEMVPVYDHTPASPPGGGMPAAWALRRNGGLLFATMIEKTVDYGVENERDGGGEKVPLYEVPPVLTVFFVKGWLSNREGFEFCFTDRLEMEKFVASKAYKQVTEIQERATTDASRAIALNPPPAAGGDF